MDAKQAIVGGNTSLGIEFGSTRIRAVLAGADSAPLALGNYAWGNQMEDGLWTYHLDDVWNGLQECYQYLKVDVKEKYGLDLTTVGSIGISAIMHGYLVFDQAGGQLVSFRTSRNIIAKEASIELTAIFDHNIPHYWSIAHLYQAMLNDEEHLPNINFMTTLAGYVHWKLTGEKVVGSGDASGMFPLDSKTGSYDLQKLVQFDQVVESHNLPWKLADILPRVLKAGEKAGNLSKIGAMMMDFSGTLQAGIPFCPSEGIAADE